MNPAPLALLHEAAPHSGDVACGSPFFPDSGPPGNVTNYWHTWLGFGDQTVESSSERTDACADVMLDFRATEILLLVAGMVGFAALVYRTSGAALISHVAIGAPVVMDTDAPRPRRF